MGAVGSKGIVISRSVVPRNASRKASAMNSGSLVPVRVFISHTLPRHEQASQQPSSENRRSSGEWLNSTGGNSGSSPPNLYNRSSDAELTARRLPSADRAIRQIAAGKVRRQFNQAP